MTNQDDFHEVKRCDRRSQEIIEKLRNKIDSNPIYQSIAYGIGSKKFFELINFTIKEALSLQKEDKISKIIIEAWETRCEEAEKQISDLEEKLKLIEESSGRFKWKSYWQQPLKDEIKKLTEKKNYCFKCGTKLLETRK